MIFIITKKNYIIILISAKFSELNRKKIIIINKIYKLCFDSKKKIKN